MLTPQDVRSVQFEKNLRGYRTEDVDRFLDKIEEQLQQDDAQAEQLRKQIADLTAENQRLHRELQSYEADGEMLKSALINAQRMGESVIREANQKAEEIIHRANLRGDDIIRDANELLQKSPWRTRQLSSSLRRRLLHRSRTPPARKPILPLMPRTTRRLRAVRISGKKMKASSSWILLRMQSRTDRTMMPSRASSSASKARVHKQI